MKNITAHFENELYTAHDKDGKELKETPHLDKLEAWAKRNKFKIIEITGLD